MADASGEDGAPGARRGASAGGCRAAGSSTASTARGARTRAGTSILYAFPRGAGDDGPRLGISVGRKVGGAVERNRVKRALRESFWEQADPLPETHDFVIVARPEAAKLTAEEGEPGLCARRSASYSTRPD